ncbi:MAG: hypothetical protein E7604_01025 [Ruminococcaceae bacterium]|nr:hypothetical protein [Oscillospiraceae bacterium]
MFIINARAILTDESVVEIPVELSQKDDILCAVPVHDGIGHIKYIDLGYNLADAHAGMPGYYAVPRGSGSPDDHICCFTERENTEILASDFQMPMFGYTNGNDGWCAIVTGYTYDYQLIIGVRDGNYYMYPRFPFENGRPWENIAVQYRLLHGADASYSGMARVYRQYLLDECGIKPLRERLNEQLAYAAESLYIRIRMAWKPVPSPVEEQTEDNEPPIHVAITFDEVGALLDKCKDAGVKKAEFCLVGWNKSGHDGRWPQSFPAEPLLGGEEALRRLIEKAQAMGYQITCHTNSTDAYSIADCYQDDIVRINRDGSEARHGICWGGGLPRWVCPDKAVGIAREQLPKIAKLGFRGLHYIDVISTIALPQCFSPEHPVSRRKAHDDYVEIARMAHDLFGGFSSEGGYDHTLPYLDYGLYVSFYDTENEKLPPMFTKSVPLWQVALHGIILSNPYTTTVNAPVKSRRHQLEMIERGGRPTVYLFSKFKSDGKSWMGNDDITCSNPADTAKTVQILADLYREFEPMARLQTLFIENHEEIRPDVVCTTYEDGTKITVDFANGKYWFDDSKSCEHQTS